MLVLHTWGPEFNSCTQVKARCGDACSKFSCWKAEACDPWDPGQVALLNGWALGQWRINQKQGVWNVRNNTGVWALVSMCEPVHTDTEWQKWLLSVVNNFTILELTKIQAAGYSHKVFHFVLSCLFLAKPFEVGSSTFNPDLSRWEDPPLMQIFRWAGKIQL